MGLREDIRGAVKDAFFVGLGDIPQPWTYNCLAPGTSGIDNYDDATGAPNAAVVPYIIPQVVFTRYKEDNPDKDVVVSTDAKLLFQTAQLPVTPKTGDTMVDLQMNIWVVQRYQTDPVGVVAIVQVRGT